MTNQDLPSPEFLRKLLRYEPDTGKLFWLKRTPDMFADSKQSAAHNCAIWNGKYAEKEAFTSMNGEGYFTGTIFGCRVSAHRVAYAIYYKRWPADQIDHINGIADDNRIVNLREVSHRENLRNQRRRSSNTSGVMGVYWDKQTGKWRALIYDCMKLKHLGRFDAKADAIAARKAAEIELGYHENHGRTAP